MQADIDELKEDEKGARAPEEAQSSAQSSGREERNERHSWIPGIVLIVLGMIFLFDNVFGVELYNWWALFILIPALFNLNSAWKQYRRAGRWTSSARSALTGGLLIGTVAVIFLFDLSWGLFWPVLLIILGAGILLRNF